MAWIKFEKDLLSDPRVVRIAKNLQSRWQMTEEIASGHGMGVCNAEALPAVTLVCGALVRIWCLADTHVGEDDVLPLGKDELDELLGIPGFCDLMPPDWLQEIDERSVKLPDFHSHNGTEAKKKAVTQKRVAAFRARNASALPARNARALPDQTKTRPDQEKPNGAAAPEVKTPVDKSTEDQQQPRWWETQEATLTEAQRLGISTRGESWDSLKRQIRDKHSSMRRVA